MPQSKLQHSLVIVIADWNDAARKWAARCDDLPELVTEASTFDELRQGVVNAIDALIQGERVEASLPEISVYITASQTTRIANPNWLS